jgi:hypothetical protein
MQHLPTFPVGIAVTDYGAPLCLLSLVSRHHKQATSRYQRCYASYHADWGTLLVLAPAQPPLGPHCGGSCISFRAGCVSLLGDDVRCGQSHATALRCRPGIFRFPAKKFHTLHVCGMTQGKVASAIEPGMTYTHSKSYDAASKGFSMSE